MKFICSNGHEWPEHFKECPICKGTFLRYGAETTDPLASPSTHPGTKPKVVEVNPGEVVYPFDPRKSPKKQQDDSLEAFLEDLAERIPGFIEVNLSNQTKILVNVQHIVDISPIKKPLVACENAWVTTTTITDGESATYTVQETYEELKDLMKKALR